MARRRLGSILWAASLAGAVFIAPNAARAQTVTVQPASLVRKLGFRSNDQNPTWINYNDCIKDDILTFQTTLSGTFSSYSLEVWVGSGTDCTTYEARLGNAPTCWQVYSTNPQNQTTSVSLRAQDIIAQNKSTDGTWGADSGTAKDCDEAGGATEGQAITLYFLLVDGTGNPQGTGSTYDTKYDLVGPSAPTNVSAGVGENVLVVDWTGSTASDRAGYRVYCDPKPGALAPASAPMAGGAAGTSGAAGAAGIAGAGGVAGASSGGGTGGVTATGGQAGAGGVAGASGAAGSTGSGGSGGNPNCPSSALVVGERPDSAYQCGSVSGKYTNEAYAKDLVNGVTYAVAVAAYDSVGNSGPLSEVACGSPQVVNNFFELYRRAGGKGGGGYCAIAAEPAPGALFALLAALGAFGLRRWRRSA
jgi:hypothetical protein